VIEKALAQWRLVPQKKEKRQKKLELYLSGRWLSGTSIIRIDWALRANLLRILQN
jgi:hypothetical protein